MGAALSEAREAPRPTQPPRPELLESSQAPRAARVLGQLRLSYDPGLAPADRDRDFLGKVALAKSLLEVGRLVDLRHQPMNTFYANGKVKPLGPGTRRYPWSRSCQVERDTLLLLGVCQL